MTIKEVEQMTGLTRSNIRYYEKEKLICPKRNENNGYREYSSEDVENIKKIAYLRTLGISIEDILKLLNKDADLYTVPDQVIKYLSGKILFSVMQTDFGKTDIRIAKCKGPV